MPSSGIKVQDDVGPTIESAFRVGGPKGKTNKDRADAFLLGFDGHHQFVEIKEKIDFERTPDQVDDLAIYKTKWAEQVQKISQMACYIVLDYEYKENDMTRKKKVLIAYICDAAKVKDKMLISSTAEAVKIACGIDILIQADEKDELGYDVLFEKIKKN